MLAILGSLETIIKLEGPRDRLYAKVFHKSVSDWLTDREAAADWFADPAIGHRVILA